jgi:uncharacterized protein
MILSKDNSDAIFQIRSYKSGSVTINDQIFQRSIIVTANEIVSDWEPQSFQEFKPEYWDPVIALKPEIILFGTGSHFKMPHPSLLAPVYIHKIAIESMDSGAACRTYMALVSEGRKVAAALIIS